MKRLKEHRWLKETGLSGEGRDIMAFIAMFLKTCCHEGQERDERAGQKTAGVWRGRLTSSFIGLFNIIFCTIIGGR